MGFYKFIKNIVRFILYQLPKKWLIMIIFALVMTFGLTQVKAVEYIDNVDTSNLTCYEYIDTGSNLVDTGICLTPGSYNNHNNYQLYVEYLQSSKSYANAFSINDEEQDDNSSESSMVLQQQYEGGQWWFRINKNWNTQDIFAMSGYTKYSLYINMYDRYASISDGANFSHQYDFSTYTNDFFSTKSVKFNSNKNYKSGTFRIYYMELTDYMPSIDTVVSLGKYYPAKYVHYLDATTTRTYTGFYNSVNNDFLIWRTGDYQYFGASIDTPTYTPPDTSTDIDYTEDLNNINNSINDTNDFLKDTNVNSSGFNVNAPAVEGQAVVSQVDNSFTNFFNDYMGILQGTSVYSIVLPIPDMRNGNVLTSINISSDYISSKLSSVPLFIPNTSLLELIHITWYLLFGFWFLFLATKLVTIIYSGDIIKNQGLLDLTRTYIGVSKNML